MSFEPTLKERLASKKVGESIVLNDAEIRTLINWVITKPISDEEFNHLDFEHMAYRGVKIIRSISLNTATPPEDQK